MRPKNDERKMADAVHKLHVLYMKYFSLDGPWEPTRDRRNEQTHLLKRMVDTVDEILHANERPNWLHPAMFHGPLTSAICSLPPIPDSNATLMPLTVNPREVFWSKFSICNHLHLLKWKPLILSLQYHPPYSLECSQNNHKSSPFSESGNPFQISSTIPFNDDLKNLRRKNVSFRVGALPNGKFRNEEQIQLEHYVGQILHHYGVQFNSINNDECKPKEYLYQLPSNNGSVFN